MENLVAFYNSLLGIEVTALGIMTAGIFVFLQMLHSNFSHKDISLYLKRPLLIVYGVLSAFTILFTAIGALLLSLGTYDFIPLLNLHTELFYEDPWNTLYVVVLLLTSLAMGAVLMRDSFKHLRPSYLLKLHFRDIKDEQARKYLLHRYGVPTPHLGISFYINSSDGRSIDSSGEEVSDEEKSAREERSRQEYDEKTRTYEKLRFDIQGTPDVFEGATALLIKAIGNNDIETLRSGNEQLAQKIRSIGAYLLTKDDEYSGKALEYLGSYVGDLLRMFTESCRRNSLPSLTSYFVNSSQSIAVDLVEMGAYRAVIELLKAWKDEADESIYSSNRLLFRKIVESYRLVGDAAFGAEGHEAEGLLDEVFRKLGWLAERLIAEKGIQSRPDMHDTDYEDEFGAIFNAIFHFEYKYDRNPLANPYVFFEAIYVLFGKMLEEYVAKTESAGTRNKDGNSIKSWLFSCTYAYSSFAEAAMKVGNADGVGLGVSYLRQIYRRAAELGAVEVEVDILDSMVRLSMSIAAHEPSLAPSQNYLERPEEVLEEIFLNSSEKDVVYRAVCDAYLNQIGQGSHEKRWKYLKSLGVKMGTNFGYRFHPVTGADYAK